MLKTWKVDLGRYLFAALLYAVPTALIAGISAGGISALAINLVSSQGYEMFILVGVYVFMLGVPCCFLMFLLSLNRKAWKLDHPTADYLWTSISAAIALIIFFAIGGSAFLMLGVFLVVSSLIPIYYGTKIYRVTMSKLESILATPGQIG